MLLQYSESHISQWLPVSWSGTWGSEGHLGRADELFRLSATSGGGLPPRVFFYFNRKYNLLVISIDVSGFV